MLTLDVRLRIPAHVLSSKVAQASVLLNTKTKKYYSLDEVGRSFWEKLKSGMNLRDTYQAILSEYEVAPDQLEADLLELVQHLMDSGLVEIAEA